MGPSWPGSVWFERGSWLLCAKSLQQRERCKGLASAESSFRIYPVNRAVLQSSDPAQKGRRCLLRVPVSAGSGEQWNHTLLQALRGVGKDFCKVESGETTALHYLHWSLHLDETRGGIFTWVQGENDLKSRNCLKVPKPGILSNEQR